MFRIFLVLVGVSSMTMVTFPTPISAASVYSQMPSYCTQHPPRSEGYCTVAIEGYYFDPRTNNCEKYEVGGCRLISGQSFGSRDDCLATCLYLTRHIQDLRTE